MNEKEQPNKFRESHTKLGLEKRAMHLRELIGAVGTLSESGKWSEDISHLDGLFETCRIEQTREVRKNGRSHYIERKFSAEILFEAENALDEVEQQIGELN